MMDKSKNKLLCWFDCWGLGDVDWAAACMQLGVGVGVVGVGDAG